MIALDLRMTRMEVPPLPRGRANVILIGAMGSGKTTTGRALAQRLGYHFIDTDTVIESRAGRPVAEIFVQDGEDEFRRMERGVMRDLRTISATVIATGGGAVLHEQEMSALRSNAVVVHLQCDPKISAARLPEHDRRPLLRGSDDIASRIAAITADRSHLYANADLRIDTGDKSPDAVCDLTAGLIPGDRLVTIDVATEPRGCPVAAGAGAITALDAVLEKQLPDARRAVVVIDRGAPRDVVAMVLERAGRLGGGVTSLTLDGGEAAKDLTVLAQIWSACADAQLTRCDVLVAVGGGAVLDVAGFAASTYARGVPLINIPTTLLAMVDAAVGGKNAVNHGGLKNLAGTTRQPAAVICDSAVFADSPSVIRQGLAEVMKAGVLASPLLCDMIDAAGLDWIIEQSVRIKAGYVVADPGDTGLRQSLNLGHTFAHAIESASGYSITHGDAVAAGLRAACRLGESIGLTSREMTTRVCAALDKTNLDVALPDLSHEALHAAILRDKKRTSAVRFVVPNGDGASLVSGIDVNDALRFVEAG